MTIKNPLISLFGLALLAVISGCKAGSASPANAAPRLRILTYNIHHGRGADNVIDLKRVAEVINRVNPDIVALQEVDVRTRRSASVDQLKELARLTKMHGRFGKGRDFEGGDYGQAILSKWPIASFKVHSLPPANDADRRIAIDARIRGDGHRPDVRVVGTHLHHINEDFRLAQARRLTEILTEDKDDKTPIILVGDFNAVPGSPTMDFLLEGWDDTMPDTGRTYPATQPTKKIDWVLLPRGHRWHVVERRVIDEQVASDHRPVVVELELTSPSEL